MTRQNPPKIAVAADFRPGVVVQWRTVRWIPRHGWSEAYVTGPRLRVTRPARHQGDWLAVSLDPGPDERPGYEWLVHHRQIGTQKFALIQEAPEVVS